MDEDWKAKQVAEVTAMRDHLRRFMLGQAGAEMALVSFLPAVGALEVRLWHLGRSDA